MRGWGKKRTSVPGGCRASVGRLDTDQLSLKNWRRVARARCRAGQGAGIGVSPSLSGGVMHLPRSQLIVRLPMRKSNVIVALVLPEIRM